MSMNIQSAQYVNDDAGNQVAVQVTYEDSNGEVQTCSVPADGVTWQNQELKKWLAGGGKIAAAQPVQAA